jgi:tetratricopeptide (TPR) repeat protein
MYFKFAASFLLMFGFLVTSASAQTKNRQASADSLYAHYKFTEAFDAYHDVLNQNHDDVSALWHSSLLYSRLGSELKSKKQQRKYYMIARKQARRALKLSPHNSMANYAMAVSLGRLAVISSVKQKVAASREIREYTIRAVQADSDNDGAWNILCRWNYEISHMNSFERMAAKVLFGGVPKGASFAKAVKYGKKAIELDPVVVGYYRDLALAYKAVGKDQKAVETCRAALKKPPVFSEGVSDKKQCRKLIAHLH